MAKILIVENSSFMKGMLKTILEYSGHTVIGTAENDIKALTLYKEKKPDIVTIDILMNGLDGIPILKKIKEYDSKSKVIMVSVFGQELKTKEAKENGAEGFILKPYKHSEILELIDEIFPLNK